jgi:glycosyltransferase involved in cell wall biosynthesis
LHKRNGGLSAARNTGIEFALAAFPDLEAVYFLDCDNRIGPHLLQRLLTALRDADANVGWAYPDIDKFGFAEFNARRVYPPSAARTAMHCLRPLPRPTCASSSRDTGSGAAKITASTRPIHSRQRSSGGSSASSVSSAISTLGRRAMAQSP